MTTSMWDLPSKVWLISSTDIHTRGALWPAESWEGFFAEKGLEVDGLLVEREDELQAAGTALAKLGCGETCAGWGSPRGGRMR